MDNYYAPELGDNYTRIHLLRPCSSSHLEIDVRELWGDSQVKVWIATHFTGWIWLHHSHYTHDRGKIDYNGSI